eukprot:GGOE01046350.1.p1 GENE.GGOE01046350.1~~GGOE01046350.1.p1  ORF type:complete len:447 (-),score=73.40 GGOE01046350.1:169-1509(-)
MCHALLLFFSQHTTIGSAQINPNCRSNNLQGGLETRLHTIGHKVEKVSLHTKCFSCLPTFFMVVLVITLISIRCIKGSDHHAWCISHFTNVQQISSPLVQRTLAFLPKYRKNTARNEIQSHVVHPKEPVGSGTWLQMTGDASQNVSLVQREVQMYLMFIIAVLFAGGSLTLTISSVLKDVVAGVAASICTTLAGYPLDTAKTRLQTGQKAIGSDGFVGLYKGLGIGLLREASTTAIYIATCGFLKLCLVPADAVANLNTLLIFLFIGAVACLASCVSRMPLEFVSRQIQSGECWTLPDAAWKVLCGPDGSNVAKRAWVAVTLREVTQGATQLVFFEVFKLLFSFLADWNVPISFQRMVWGAMAGFWAAFLTTPLDVITFSVMLTSFQHMGEEGAGKPRSIWGMAHRMFQEGGLGVFFAGSLPRAVFFSIGTCLFFSVFRIVAAALK